MQASETPCALPPKMEERGAFLLKKSSVGYSLHSSSFAASTSSASEILKQFIQGKARAAPFCALRAIYLVFASCKAVC
jgi:hypothetical protein